MKKLLLSSIILLIFSASILLFQASCKKSADAASPSTATTSVTQQNKIIYEKQFYGSGTQLFDHGEIWSANYDGTSQQQISISLPTNVVIALIEPKISPDGKTIFFNAFLTDGKSDISNGWDLYACNIDGTNVRQVIKATGNSVTIGSAY